jgi:undecaprenyl-diphosphatase
MLLLKTIILGIIEGVTEFIPVSSTGHLIVASEVLNYPPASRETFEIFIQLGAILAVVWHFRTHLIDLARRAPHDATARALVAKVVLAFVPAALVGLAFGHAIEQHLFRPSLVGFTLILGGLIIIVIERRTWRFSVHAIDAVGWRQSLGVGVAQILSLVPGVSRAGATIIGGMIAGLDRPTATQFSFYLSIPTMFAASSYSLLKALPRLSAADTMPFAVGFVVAFVSALAVVRLFITFVQRHTFTAFGYYRIAFGLVVLALLG